MLTAATRTAERLFQKEFLRALPTFHSQRHQDRSHERPIHQRIGGNATNAPSSVGSRRQTDTATSGYGYIPTDDGPATVILGLLLPNIQELWVSCPDRRQIDVEK